MAFDGGPAPTSPPPTRSTPRSAASDTNFTVTVWFKSSAANGGGLIGMGNAQTPTTPTEPTTACSTWARTASSVGGPERELQLAESTQAYNDGQLAQAVATIGANGQYLYVDGNLVGAQPTTTAQNYGGPGWWTIGRPAERGQRQLARRVRRQRHLDNLAGTSPGGRRPVVAQRRPGGPALRGLGLHPARPDLHGLRHLDRHADQSGTGGTYWPLNDSVGSGVTTTAADLSGSGDTGQVNGGVTQGVTGPLACDPLSTGSP